ncbi:hypothetical protein M406DRAFT_346216 [Cryphonectria parasitica EP155]|uniref:Nudix hydrolase domain-containing protein n=1 Tax=Cryphonectria parasitica (strain ATCC 38755 / EP155) TaxID=660469 RepID=A0A9P4Y4A5_CRYP1|nr:uncharacterized protein M406DRAFT_346216 [Cryphonectria parasitica EP155]KAF3766199.1 hypothetical protein M406DRAFT_346216 [Cryphonectria parasitica EP155]
MSGELPAISWKEDQLDFFGENVTLYLPSTITKDELENHKAFRDWKQVLHKNLSAQAEDKHPFHAHQYKLRWIEIQSVDRFPPMNIIGFIKLNARIERDHMPDDDTPGQQAPRVPKTLPGIAFLRGGSVAMLMILKPRDSRDERYVVLTEQPRIPSGSLRFLEIPAGMLDAENNFKGKVADEIEEETGFRIPPAELVDMTALALKDTDHPERTSLQTAMYPSPGGCDEYIALFLWEKDLDRQEIEDLKGKLTGERAQDESITLHVRAYEDLWKEGARDAKTLAAWALYEGLNRSGELQEYQKRKRESSSSGSSRSKVFDNIIMVGEQ